MHTCSKTHYSQRHGIHRRRATVDSAQTGSYGVSYSECMNVSTGNIWAYVERRTKLSAALVIFHVVIIMESILLHPGHTSRPI